jgi:hypothetical protein
LVFPFKTLRWEKVIDKSELFLQIIPKGPKNINLSLDNNDNNNAVFILRFSRLKACSKRLLKVHSRTFSTPWRAYSRAADSMSALQATQPQMSSLPARYPFYTWVRWGNWDKETYQSLTLIATDPSHYTTTAPTNSISSVLVYPCYTFASFFAKWWHF